MDNLELIDFEESLRKKTFREKTQLLFNEIKEVGNINKIKILLSVGANPKKIIDDVSIWSFAFSQDLFRDEKDLIFPILIPYIFNNFEDDFIKESKDIIIESWKKYKNLNQKSKLITQNTKSEKLLKKLDEEYENITDDMSLKIELLHYEILKKINDEFEKQEKEDKKNKFKIVK